MTVAEMSAVLSTVDPAMVLYVAGVSGPERVAVLVELQLVDVTDTGAVKRKGVGLLPFSALHQSGTVIKCA